MKSGIKKQKAQMNSDKRRRENERGRQREREGAEEPQFEQYEDVRNLSSRMNTQKISQLPWLQLGKCVKMAIFCTNTLRETLSYRYTDTKILTYSLAQTDT